MSGPLISQLQLSLVAFFFISGAGATVFRVSPEGNGANGLFWHTAFPTIGEALAAASTGDQIWVREGRYVETIDLKSGVSLFGGFRGTEREDQFDVRDPAARPTILDASRMDTVVKAVDLSSATLDGLVLTQGMGTKGGGVSCQSSGLILQDCELIDNNGSEDGGGLYIEDSLAFISRLTIRNNTTRGFGGGIYINEATVVINHSRILSSTLGQGIYARRSDLALMNSTVSGHHSPLTGGGIDLLRSKAEISTSTITHNFSHDDGGGISAFTSSLQIYDSVISHNTTSNGVLESGGGLWISNDSIVDNCVISHNESPCGAGIHIDGRNNLIRGCTVEYNDAGLPNFGISAAGIEYDGIGTENRIVDCLIRRNRGPRGSGLEVNGGGLKVSGCVITENTAELGFTFQCCAGGGVHVSGPCEFERCIIADNFAVEFGGGVSIVSGVSFENCLIAGNRAGKRGGAIFRTREQLVRLSNCTLVENEAPEASAIRAVEGPTMIVNSILRNSGTSEILFNEGFATIDARYSNIKGGWPGEGNIDEDPLFIDPEDGNYRLQLSSPCIDTASTEGPQIDLDRVPRPIDHPGTGRDGEGAFDMGAYELQGAFRNSKSDINEDGHVNLLDLLILKGDWKKEISPLDAISAK